MRHVFGLALLLGCSDSSPPPPAAPEVHLVELVDNQVQKDGAPARYPLYQQGMARPAPESGPDLQLQFYLSAALDPQAAAAPGIVVRDSEAQPVKARGRRLDGTGMLLTLIPDLRSAKDYSIFFDTTRFLASDRQRFLMPPELPFRTARRFVVLSSTPGSMKSVPMADRVRLSFSSPVQVRFGGYGVHLRSCGAPMDVPLDVELSSDGRSMSLLAHCPLPQGPFDVDVDRDGVEEDGTLNPLSTPFHDGFTVSEMDRSGCSDTAPDLRAPPDMSADM